MILKHLHQTRETFSKYKSMKPSPEVKCGYKQLRSFWKSKRIRLGTLERFQSLSFFFWALLLNMNFCSLLKFHYCKTEKLSKNHAYSKTARTNKNWVQTLGTVTGCRLMETRNKIKDLILTHIFLICMHYTVFFNKTNPFAKIA